MSFSILIAQTPKSGFRVLDSRPDVDRENADPKTLTDKFEVSVALDVEN